MTCAAVCLIEGVCLIWGLLNTGVTVYGLEAMMFYIFLIIFCKHPDVLSEFFLPPPHPS